MYKKVMQKYRERTILKRIFLCTFGISAFFITIACFIGFAWIKDLKMHELVKSDQETLSNYYAVIENTIDSAQKSLETLYKNVYVKRVIINSESSWNDNMSVVANSILSSISVNKNLHSIYIFGKEGILQKSSNFQYPLTKKVDEMAERTFKNSFLKRMNPWSYTDIYDKKRQIVSLALGDFKGREKAFESGIEVNVDMGSITKELFPLTVKGENYIILTREGLVLAEAGEEYEFGENISEDSFTSQVFSQKDKKNTVTLKRDGISYFIGYIRSADRNYYLLHIYPYSNLVRNIAYTRDMVILGGILLVFISLLSSAFVAFKVYHPIDEVMDYVNYPGAPDQISAENGLKKYKELSVISEKMKMMARQLNHFNEEKEADYMIHYLNSRHSSNKIPAVFREHVSNAANQEMEFCCVVLRICNIEGVMQEKAENDILEQINDICEMTKAAYEVIAKMLLYVIDSEYIAAFLIWEKTKEESKELNTLLVKQSESILKKIKEEALIPINIGISGSSNEPAYLYQLYQTAKAITKYRFLFGENAVITEEQIQNCSFGGSGKEFELNELTAQVKKLDKQAFIREFGRLEEFIKKHSLQTGYDLLISLACEMFQYHNEITQYRSSLGFLDYENAQKEILSFQYINDALPWFLILFDKIQDTICEARKKGTGEIIENAVKYIMEHYNDTNLSAQQLAERFNITPSYFSRIFNEYTNCAFPDYLTDIRLEQAKRMLIEEPSNSIQHICEEVGYLSSSYFTAQFKKKYGIPPSKYRLNNHIQ